MTTEAEARALVQYSKYPPKGTRSNGPVRAGLYGEGGSYQKTANDEILVIPMIETQEAVDNLEAILDVPGIDAVYIGPSDLGFSMGLPPVLDREEPQIISIYEHIVQETKRRNLRACIHCLTPAYAARMIGMGFNLVTLGNDSGLLLTAARAAIKATRTP